MLLFVFTTNHKRFVIFTRRYFKLSWNTTALSQSNCRNFSCSSIKIVNSWRQDRALNNLWRRYCWSQRIMGQMKHTIWFVHLGKTFRFGQVIEKPRMSQNCGRHTVRKSVSIQASPMKGTFERRPKSYGFFKNSLLKSIHSLFCLSFWSKQGSLQCCPGNNSIYHSFSYLQCEWKQLFGRKALLFVTENLVWLL